MPVMAPIRSVRAGDVRGPVATMTMPLPEDIPYLFPDNLDPRMAQ